MHRWWSTGDDLFAVAYQGRVARLARETGQIDLGARPVELPRPGAWMTTRSTSPPPMAIWCALDRQTGAEQWHAEGARAAPAVGAGGLSRPCRGRPTSSGFVHWFDRDGDLRARQWLVGGRIAITCKGMPIAARQQSAGRRRRSAAGVHRSRRAQRVARAAARGAAAPQLRSQPWAAACCRSSRSSAGRMSASRRCSMR